MGVSYIGTNFYGWQDQYNKQIRTVQSCVEQTLSKIANNKIKVFCSGRTDTGVHALEQVIHFDSNVFRSEKSWLYGGNRYLPKDISFLWSKKVDNSFHARFSATARMYRYNIYNEPLRNCHSQPYSLWIAKKLDINAMNEAIEFLKGEYDFSAFRSSQCQSQKVIRKVYKIELDFNGKYLTFTIVADGFLHKMVRNLVGTILEVGLGRKKTTMGKKCS